METDYIYWRHHTPIGVKVEEVSGGEGHSQAVWRAMAMQVWKENGRDGYRDIDHTEGGAPMLWGEHSRISVTHTSGLLVVATLPPTPEVSLEEFSERTALGIDTERADRTKVLDVRPRFLSEEEAALVPEKDLTANVVAWTCKEALYKAALTSGLDWHNKIRIKSLPVPDGAHGAAEVEMAGQTVPFILYTYRSGAQGEFIVTIAITPRTATYVKEKHKPQ